MDNDYSARSIFERVNRGAALLDAHFGSRQAWASQINADRLDIESYKVCILGQLFGGYSTGLSSLCISEGSRFGFSAEYPTGPDVEATWRSLVSQATVPPVQARLELTPKLVEQLAKLSADLHDANSPLAVIELDMNGVRVVLV